MTPFDWCAEEVRRHDRERWLTALFAPGPARRRLLALYAFNLEVARAREQVTQPTLGLVRLQWWREGLDGIYAGRPRQHPVALALAEVLAEVPLDRRPLDRLLQAREADMEERPIADLTALEAYAEGTASTLVTLALAALGVADPASATAGRHVGIAWALTGLLRALPYHARQRRLYLPASLLAQTGADPEAVLQGRPSPQLARAVAQIADAAAAHLRAARAAPVPRAAMPALLTASLADRHLARLRAAGHDPFAALPAQAGPLNLLRLLWRARRGVV